MGSLQNILNLVKYNVKIIFNLNAITAIVMVSISPSIFSFKLIPYASIAKIGELYLSIIGIILFSYIGSIEKRENINEVSYVKKLSHSYIFMTRLMVMAVFGFLLVLSVTVFANYQGGEFPFWIVTWGIWISILFLGMIGLSIANLTHNLTAGYLAAFTYFAFEFTTKGQYTKNFFLFSLLKNSFYQKYWVLILIVLMIVGNIIYVYKES